MPLRIEKLRRDHSVEAFHSGSEPLDRFLIRYALPSQLSNSSQTYLAPSADEIVGFYIPVFGQIATQTRPSASRRGLPRVGSHLKQALLS
jgi:hypothetical protein